MRDRRPEHSFQVLPSVLPAQMTALSLPRLLILTIGPFAVMAVAYLVAAPQASSGALRPNAGGQAASVDRKSPSAAKSLAERCQIAAEKLRQSLPETFQIVTRSPFLMAGDLPKSQLQGLHADVIAPVARALQATYFERQPQHPITIVVCSTEDLFRQLAAEWDGHLEPGYHGYYQRDKHRILLDLEAGNGSLAHELTHALTQCDCEHLPEWFDEGLGALHEEATYAPGSQRLVGLPNWRCRLTQQAARAGKLPSITSLANPQTFRSGDVGLNYAVSRSICLFLQERQVLTAYYKALRTRPRSDAQGMTTLCRVLGVQSEAQAQRQFANWINRKK